MRSQTADIVLEANLATKCLSVHMRLKAPLDKKSANARVNWLTRMIKDDDPRLGVRAAWPGRAPNTQALLTALREEPGLIQGDNPTLVPHSFDILLIEELGGRFTGSRTFIEDVERVVPQFYDLVGQYLRAWHPAPPKPVAAQERAEAPTYTYSAEEQAQ